MTYEFNHDHDHPLVYVLISYDLQHRTIHGTEFFTLYYLRNRRLH